MAKPKIDLGPLVSGVRSGERAAISRAITLVESSRPDHRASARELLHLLATPAEGEEAEGRPEVEEAGGRPEVEGAGGRPEVEEAEGRSEVEEAGGRHETPTVRVGISGVPGVGKSTFIEALGKHLTGLGHRVGVLAVDPSSVRTGGSVLGDKTRMQSLATDPNAFIRPSPSAGTLGGVARATAQAMLVLEAAGYDVILIETVGVGQSEVTVAGMVDTFLFLTLARTGDQLQGIKKGILEIADVIAVNKADDGDQELAAKSAAKELSGALRLVYGGGAWVPPVLTAAGLTGKDVDVVWERILKHREHLGEQGLVDKRAAQQWEFTWALVRDELDQRLAHSPGVRAIRSRVRSEVLSGETVAPMAADEILAAFDAD